MNLEQLDNIVKRVARRTGLDDYELFLTFGTSLNCRIENWEITVQLKKDIFSGSLRVIKNRRMGFVPFTEPSPGVLELGIKIAVNMAPAAPFDSFAVIPDRLKTPPAFDPEIVRLLDNPSRIKTLAQELIKRAFDTGKITTLEGLIQVNREIKLISTFNSPVPAIAERTAFSAFAEVNTQDFDFVAGRKLPDLEKVAALGASVARELPGTETTPEAEGIKGKIVPVVLHPSFTEEMIRQLVAEHLYASTVQDGMSQYHLNELVMSPLITAGDDATIPFGESTFPVDDEGTPARKNLVVENGVLKMFLYDRTTASRENVQSTGNGRRRPVLIEEEHEAPVRCTINDIFIIPGTTPLTEIIKKIDYGVLIKVLLGFHTANRTTGDFANTLYFGRIIRNGELAELPQAGRWAIKGNALNALRNVKTISRETLSTGSAILPWLQTELTVA
jgi:predicted Zn-dependent protease